MLIKKAVSSVPSAESAAQAVTGDHLVYSNVTGLLALVVSDDNGFIGYIPFNEDVMRVNSIGRATFLEHWAPTDHSLKEGIERFVTHLNDYGAMYDASGAVKELVKKHGLEDYFAALEQGGTPASESAAPAVVEEVAPAVIEPPVAAVVESAAVEPVVAEVMDSPAATVSAVDPMATIAAIAAGDFSSAIPSESAPAAKTKEVAPPKSGVVEQVKPETKPKETPKMTQESQSALPEITRKVGDFQVSVANGQVHIEMGSNKADDGKLTTDDFASKPLSVEPQDELMFYVALDKEQVMRRCASISVGDRATVGAMIGNWAAEGFLVQAWGTKEMLKQFRALESAKKQAGKVATDPAGGNPDGGAPDGAGSEG